MFAPAGRYAAAKADVAARSEYFVHEVWVGDHGLLIQVEQLPSESRVQAIARAGRAAAKSILGQTWNPEASAGSFSVSLKQLREEG